MRPRAAFAAAALALAVLATATGACGGESRETVTVFAASSLTDAFTELGEAFEAAHPRTAARFSFAGSAALRTQALEGAPVDVFASASPDEVEALAAAGLVVEQRALAGNRLVVAVVEDAAVDTLADLAAPGLRLALAAEAVPAGRYARRMLALANGADGFPPDFAARVLANVRSHEPNVRAALARVELGEADAAIVYASDLARAASNVRAAPVPARFQAAADYRIALLREGEAARAFLAFAVSPEGAAILARHGFAPAGGAP